MAIALTFGGDSRTLVGATVVWDLSIRGIFCFSIIIFMFRGCLFCFWFEVGRLGGIELPLVFCYVEGI